MMAEKKLNNNYEFTLINDTFDPEIGSIEVPLESIDFETLLMVADVYKDERALEELKRRGFDLEAPFRKASEEADETFRKLSEKILGKKDED